MENRNVIPFDPVPRLGAKKKTPGRMNHSSNTVKMILFFGLAFNVACSNPDKKSMTGELQVNWKAAKLENCPTTVRSGEQSLALHIEFVNNTYDDTVLIYNDSYPSIPEIQPRTFSLNIDANREITKSTQLGWIYAQSSFPFSLKVGNFLDNQMRAIHPGDTLHLKLYMGILCQETESVVNNIKGSLEHATVNYRLLINKDSLKRIYPTYHIFDSTAIKKSDDFQFFDQYGNVIN